MERGRDVAGSAGEMSSERRFEERGRPDEYTIVGIVDDGAELNRSVKEMREVGLSENDITVIVKRDDPDETEPLPDGTLYIVVPDDRRGLEVPVGFAISFIVLGLFFALVVPSIGIPTFLVFISLAAILFAGSFTRVGIDPILTDIEAPREEAGAWNDQFEMGKVLVFAITDQRRFIRPVREILEAGGSMYYIVDGRLQPRAVGTAVLHRAGPNESGASVFGARNV